MTWSTPTGPSSISRVSDSRADITNDPITVQAQAGNVTQLTITADQISQRWQGYYGNISGTIVLEDASNFTLFQWDTGVSNAQGEVYAAISTVSNWAEVYCANLSTSQPGVNCTGPGIECLNITELQGKFGGAVDASESITGTFQNLSNISIHTRDLINCSAVHLFQNDSTSRDNTWAEVILWENNTENVIFASIIDNDEWGFNNRTWDFQMIVGANQTPQIYSYNFYVELT